MAREAAEQQEQEQPGGNLGQSEGATQTPINDPTPAQIYAREDLVSKTERPTFVTDYAGAEESLTGRIDPTWAIAGGGLVALGGGICGAWLYSRWQRERNKPINRLRRQARGWLDGVGGRLPEADEMRQTAPISGGGLGLLLGGLAVARLLHVGGWGKARPGPSAEELRGTRWGTQLRSLKDLDLQAARKKAPSVDVGAARKKAPKVDVTATRKRAQSLARQGAPRPMGFGLAGLVGVVAVGYLAWRLVRGGSPSNQPDWYLGSERRAEVPNQ